jgi:RNA recognition motif-containing protein
LASSLAYLFCYWGIRRDESNACYLLHAVIKLKGSLYVAHFVTHMTIYVGNLSYRATEADLKLVFAEYGEVKRVVLPTDRDTGRMRGFAFVDMSEDAQEDVAITELDGAEWMGRQLRVNKAKPREEERRSNWTKRES